MLKEAPFLFGVSGQVSLDFQSGPSEPLETYEVGTSPEAPLPAEPLPIRPLSENPRTPLVDSRPRKRKATQSASSVTRVQKSARLGGQIVRGTGQPESQTPEFLVHSQPTKQVRLLVSRYRSEANLDIHEHWVQLITNAATDHSRGADSIATRLYFAIEGIDKAVESRLRLQRILCFALAKLPFNALSRAFELVQQTTDYDMPRSRISKQHAYRWVHIGNKWTTILSTFASIVAATPHEVTGLLCALGSVST